MLDPSDYLARAKIVNDHVKEQLNHKSIRYNWHEADVTVLEGILARGDRKISKAILYVYEHGGFFDAWSEFFHYDLWRAAEHGGFFDDSFYGWRHLLHVALILIFILREHEATMKFSRGILLMSV